MTSWSLTACYREAFDLFFSSLQCDPLAKKLSEGSGKERLLLTLTTADFYAERRLIVLGDIRSLKRTQQISEPTKPAKIRE
jgi:hypothetical protein